MISYALGDKLSELLLIPLRDSIGIDGNIVYLGLLDKLLSQLQVAFWSSVIISSPLWFFELWRYIKPALYKSEKKIIKPFIFVSFLLFSCGILFGYFFLFPLTFKMLLGFGVTDVTAMISLKQYLVLVSKVLVFLGFTFQFPNILLILAFMGLVTKYSLKKMRGYVYVGLAILSAVLTPPDPYTMVGIWVPLVLLFELGIIVVALVAHPYLGRKNGF